MQVRALCFIMTILPLATKAVENRIIRCNCLCVFLSLWEEACLGESLLAFTAKVNHIHKMRRVCREFFIKGKKRSLKQTKEAHPRDDNLSFLRLSSPPPRPPFLHLLCWIGFGVRPSPVPYARCRSSFRTTLSLCAVWG